MSETNALLYVLLKLVAYTFWCGMGAKIFQCSNFWRKTLLGGIYRTLLGIVFGTGIFIFVGLSGILNEREYLYYLLMYVPIRWIEWGIIEQFLLKEKGSVGNIIFTKNPRTVFWRFGGIAISCLADIHMWQDMLPIGRFLC